MITWPLNLFPFYLSLTVFLFSNASTGELAKEFGPFIHLGCSFESPFLIKSLMIQWAIAVLCKLIWSSCVVIVKVFAWTIAHKKPTNDMLQNS